MLRPRSFLHIFLVLLLVGCGPRKLDIGKLATKTVSVQGIDIAYKTLGKGYPLILIMGYGGTMDLWSADMLERLASRYKVIIFDNRGMGKSSASADRFSIEQFADDAAGLMDALNIKKAHVLGWSMGTNIAQELTLLYPSKVNKLILYAADCGGKEALQPDPEAMQQLTDTSGTSSERGKRLLKLLFPQKWLKNNPDFSKYFPIPKEDSPRESIDRQTKAMEDWGGSYSRLTQILQPTLFITGTEDILTPPENSVLMAAFIPGAWLVQIRGGGHGVMYQQPDEFSKIVLLFLESNN